MITLFWLTLTFTGDLGSVFLLRDSGIDQTCQEQQGHLLFQKGKDAGQAEIREVLCAVFIHITSPNARCCFQYHFPASPIPAACPVIQVRSDTKYLGLASDPTSYGRVPQACLPSDASYEAQVFTSASHWPAANSRGSHNPPSV